MDYFMATEKERTRRRKYKWDFLTDQSQYTDREINDINNCFIKINLIFEDGDTSEESIDAFCHLNFRVITILRRQDYEGGCECSCCI
jgi:hypothetical protein